MHAAGILLLVSVGVGAQSTVSGTWRNATFTLKLEVDGQSQSVDGSIAEGASEPRPIVNGRLYGSRFKFTTEAFLNGEDVIVQWLGEIEGDDLTLTREIFAAPSSEPGPFNGPFVLHRRPK